MFILIYFSKVRLTKSFMTNVSNILVAAASFIPSEFSRKTRSLDELSRFKATELRLLLLYVLPVVLIGMPEEIYKHFLLLHCAMRILACPETVKSRDIVKYSKTLICIFVENCGALYGDAFISFNVHNLIHLPDEAMRFGPIDHFSCFFFEKKLQKITNMVRPGRHPLSQLANRIMEKRSIPSVIQPLISLSQELPFKIVKEHTTPLTPFLTVIGQMRVSKQIESIVYRKIRLSIKSPDNCVILKTGKPVVIENLIQMNNNQIIVIGREFQSNDS